MNTEEYVPTVIPTVRANTNQKILGEPKIMRATNTITVVSDVLIERAIVS